MARARPAALPLAFLAAVLTVGCQQQMAKEPYYRPLEESRFFPDGRSARPLVPGTVARGELRTDVQRFTGMRTRSSDWARHAGMVGVGNPVGAAALAAAENANYVDTFPFPVTRAVLERGRQRYNIYCVVCHDPLGTGRGKIVERGYTPPPSYHIRRLREAPVGHFFDVISRGYGSMPDYAAQVPPDDRWAIIAYIRALQRSQHAAAADVPEADRGQLNAGGNP